MAGPVQLIPPGLLGFLQLKSLGRNPSQLVESYSPTIEMLDWIMESQPLEAASDLGARPLYVAAAAGPTIGQPVPAMSVPQDEIWRVLQFTIEVSLVAGESSSFAPCFFTSVAGVTIPYLVGPPTDLYAGTAIGVRNVAYAPAPFWAPPGCQLGVYIRQSIQAGVLNYVHSARYVRCPR